MKINQLIAVPLVASLLLAGPGLPSAQAAASVYNSRIGSPITGLPLSGWNSVPLLRTGHDLRAPGMGLGRSITSPAVALTPGVKTGPTVEARQVPLGLFAAATSLTERLGQVASLAVLRDVRENDARRLSAVNTFYDHAATPKDAYDVLAGFSTTPSRLAPSKSPARTRAESVKKLSRRADKTDGAAGARVKRGEIGRGLALFAGAAAMLWGGLYGLSFSVPRLFPLLGQGSLCLLTVAGAAGVIAALVIGRNRLKSHSEGYRRWERPEVLSWGAGLLGSAAALGSGLYGLRVWAPQYLPVFAEFGLGLLSAAGAIAVPLTLVMAYDWLKERVKDRRATEPLGRGSAASDSVGERPKRERGEAPKSDRTDGSSGARIDWDEFDWGALVRIAAFLVAIAVVGYGAYSLYILLPGPIRLILLCFGGFFALVVLTEWDR